MARRAKVLVILALGLALSGCAGSTSKEVSASVAAKALPPIRLPPYVPGPLTGESTPRALGMRRPLALIVENYAPDSRPQSGLAQASTVIETLAEGGVTRFMAIYLEKDSAKVGPLRSTRMYFDHWAAGFHAILTHVGGNDDAQALLWHLPSVFNIDENRTEVNLFNTGSPLFWRSTDRAAPHNMYTSTYKLRAYAARHNENWAYSQAYLLHKQPAARAHRAHGGSLSISFVDPLVPHTDANYAVQYQYERGPNVYRRFMAGSPHVSAAGEPLRPSNVIVMQTRQAVADPAAGPTPESILIPTLGSGKAWYFVDGKVGSGTWHQRDQFAPLRFFDSRGHEVAFNPGQTWIEVTPIGSSMSWRFG